MKFNYFQSRLRDDYDEFTEESDEPANILAS